MKSFLNVFKNHKSKIVLYVTLSLVILFLVFPYKDFGDVITSFLLKQTNNTVYLQFEDLSPNLYPFGVEVTNVSLDTPFLTNSLKAKSIVARPAISQLLALKPGAFISANGVFKGQADLILALKGTKPEDLSKAKLSGTLSGMELQELSKAFHLPIDLSGKLNFDSDSIEVDTNNMTSLEGAFSAKIKDLKLGAMTLPGQLTIPEIATSDLTLDSEAKNGTVKIKKLTLGGKPSDEISANIKGQFDLKQNQFGPPIGAYDFSIELQVSQTLINKLGSAIWGVIDFYIADYKRSSPEGVSSYAFRASGQSINQPKLSPYQ